jgi:hypothetical protein
MAEVSKARTAQVHTPAGWQNTSISQIEPGSRFRMVQPDGTLVSGRCGGTEFTAGPKVTRLQPITTVLREHVRQRFSQLLTPRPVAHA